MIEIRHISKTFGDFSLRDISLTVSQNEYLVLLGPTGAGKTLLLETIAGIYRPDAGHILLNGVDITATPPRERQIAVVYQDYMLFPHLTLAQNIAFGLTLRKKESAEQISQKVAAMADLLGITHLLHRYPHTLSGGEQQRGAIARAMITQPRVLLLDEPLSAVDEFTTQRLHQEIKKIHLLSGATTIHITHRFDEAYALADRIAIMHNGRIHQEGTPETLFSQPVDCWVAGFVGCKNVFPGQAVLENNGSHVVVSGVSFRSLTPLAGEVWVSIRPEYINLSRFEHTQSSVNSFCATVTAIINRGRLLEAQLEAGISLITVLTRQSAQKLALQIGKSLYISIPVAAVHLFKEPK